MIGVRQRRGQAFETMMLVISVIVAVAILGVLLGFLGGISFGATGARDTMKSLVSKIYQRGGGSEIAKRADFDGGLRILRNDIIGETPIVEKNVKFLCAETSFCKGKEAPMDITTEKITVGDRKVSGSIAAFKQYGAGPYCICVGTTDEPGNTADYCEKNCK